jgi:hypothetical protein
MKILVLAPVAFVVACSASNPSAADAVKEFSQAYCQKLQSCFTTDFETAYPNGVSDCVQPFTSRVSDPNAKDSCSEDEIHACTHDISNMACGSSFSASTLPSSCTRC